MYKILLVDDEELVIKSLNASIDWNNYGFEVVGYALSYSEAYTKICEMKVDVVFTDVRMPGNSGLELIKSIKEKNMDTLFIVVSGYAEFAYAQKAMNYGALGYCLKPFDDIEIISFLRKAKGILDSRKSHSDIQLMDLIGENTEDSKDNIKIILSDFGLEISKSKNVFILVSLGKEKISFGEASSILTLRIGYSKYVYFVKEEVKNKFLNSNFKSAKEIKGIGVSSEINDVSGIKKAINEAEVGAYSYFTTSRNNFSLLQQHQNKSKGEKEGSLKRLDEAISRDDVPSTIKLLESMTDLFEHQSLNIKHAVIIYNQIMAFSSRLKNIQFEDYIYGFENLTNTFTNVKEMLESLKKVLSEDLNAQYEIYTQKNLNHTFKAILKHVNENFCRDLSAQSIAKEFNINSNYFSQLFKKELGISFTEYVSKLRIDYACKLLKTTDISISEVSEQLGYNDYFYFSRVFKKIMGKSPSAYRMDYC